MGLGLRAIVYTPLLSLSGIKEVARQEVALSQVLKEQRRAETRKLRGRALWGGNSDPEEGALASWCWCPKKGWARLVLQVLGSCRLNLSAALWKKCCCLWRRKAGDPRVDRRSR